MNETSVARPNPPFVVASHDGSTRTGRFRAWSARRPLTSFLLLAVGLSWSLVSAVALAWHGVIPGRRLLDVLPIPPDEVAGLLLTMGALLPAALYVTWAADGRDGLRRLGSRLLRWRVRAGWWLLVLAGLPVLALGMALRSGCCTRPSTPRDRCPRPTADGSPYPPSWPSSWPWPAIDD
jgi:hypothetical protein